MFAGAVGVETRRKLRWSCSVENSFEQSCTNCDEDQQGEDHDVASVVPAAAVRKYG